MTDNVPNLSQEHSDPGSPESSKETIRPRYITIKVSKVKESILKAAREKLKRKGPKHKIKGNHPPKKERNKETWNQLENKV